MTEDEMRTEIMRMRGELSAACACLSDLYHLVIRFGGADMGGIVLEKIRNRSFDPGSLALMDAEWREGVERFNDRLTKLLASDAAISTHDNSDNSD